MDEILPHFFKHFWNHRMALDRRNYRQLVDTTVEIANKVSLKYMSFINILKLFFLYKVLAYKVTWFTWIFKKYSFYSLDLLIIYNICSYKMFSVRKE